MNSTSSNMPDQLAEDHKIIGDELYVLYTKWNYYKLLFCTSDETIGLLNDAAEFFFAVYREVLRDDIILTLCRLLDPPSSKVKKEMRPNLTLPLLNTLVPADATPLKGELNEKVDKIYEMCKKFRQHRNRRIGHADLHTKMRRKSEILPNIGLDEVDELLGAIAETLNLIERFYDKNEHDYGEGVYGSGDAQDLIALIERERDNRRRELI